MKTPILGSAYVARSTNAADNRMVNLFPEIIPEGGQEAAFLNRAPGLRYYREIGSGPIRGMWTFGGDLYVVSGNECYKVGAEPVTAASDGSLVEGPDDCGIASATGITGDGTVTLTVTGGSAGGCDPAASPLTTGGATLSSLPLTDGGSKTLENVRKMVLVGTGTKLLAAGGVRNNGAGFYSNNQYAAVYDIATDSWSFIDNFPGTNSNPGDDFAWAGVAISDTEAIIVGVGGAFKCDLSLGTGNWTILTKPPGNGLDGFRNPGRHTLEYDDSTGTVYLIGGLENSGVPSIPILQYDVATDTWSTAPGTNTPAVRQYHGSTLHNGIITLFAGYDFGASAYNGEIHHYNIATQEWTTSPDSTYFGAVVVGDRTGEGYYRFESNRMVRHDLTDFSETNLGAIAIGTVADVTQGGACALYVLSDGSSGAAPSLHRFGEAGVSVNSDPTYQYTVGAETWPETPLPWANLSDATHIFTLATLTFDNVAPTTTAGTYTNLLVGPTTETYGSLLGSVAGTGPVSMADNGTQLFIAADGPSYLYDTGALTFNQITDVDFPGAVTVGYIDGFFVFNEPGSQLIYCSALNDGADIPAEWEGAVGSPDEVVGLIVDHREVWVFGTSSVEVWYNAGTAGFPLARIQGAFNEIGCAAPYSIAKLDNGIFWLGQDARGQGIVYRSNGYTGQRISTHAVEWQIQQYGDLSDAIAYTYQQDGHSFYVLTFPSADATWVYDVSTGAWHERAGFENGQFTRHRSNCQVFFDGETLVGDYETGTIYALDLNEFSDDGQPQKWLRSWRALPSGANDFKRTAHHSLQLACESGVGLEDGQGSDPQVMLRWSDDGGHTWSNERWAGMGGIGRYGTRIIWRRLGMTKKLRDRVYEVSGTDPVKVVILGAELLMSGTDG